MKSGKLLLAACAATLAGWIWAAPFASTPDAQKKENPVALLAAEEGRIFLVCPTGETTWERKVEGRPTRIGSLQGVLYWEADGKLWCADIVTGGKASPAATDKAEKAFKGRPPVGKTEDMMAKVGLAPGKLTAPVYQQRLFLWPNETCLTVPAADVAKMRASAKAAGLVPPLKPRRILVVSRSFGYGHVEALAWGARGFKAAGEVTGAFAADTTDDITRLGDAAALAAYDAVVINNCTSVSKRSAKGMDKILTDYVRAGKGVAFIHSAMDSFYDCPEITVMSGGKFTGHPWHLGDWSFVNEEPDHPLSAPFGGAKEFRATDEIYMQKTPPYDRTKTHVLVSMNMKDKATADSAAKWDANPKLHAMFPLRTDGDFAVSWYHAYGRGRVFHTSFGHDQHGFLDPRTFAHMLLGVQYAIGDLTFAPKAR